MLVIMIVFISVLISSVSGFGSSLIAMPLLTTIIGVREASPLVVLIVLVQNIMMIIKYRQSFHWKDIGLLSLGAVFGIPFGVYALTAMDEQIILTVLGSVLVLYSLYALSSKTLPLIQRRWASLFGFFGGGLAGAYNTYGPPILIYGNCRNWSPAALKGNVQLFGLLNSVFVISLHTYHRNFTPDVINMFWISLPVVALASFLGFKLDRFINKQLFRRMVCILLLLVGLKMIVFP